MTPKPPHPNRPPPRGRNYNPYDHAEQLGIQVIERPIRTANELWLPDHHTIVIRTGLRAIHKRTALAHGIAHAELGHRDDRPKHELQADRRSLLHLIHPDEFAEVAEWAGSDAGILCAELGITHRLLEVYLRRA